MAPLPGSHEVLDRQTGMASSYSTPIGTCMIHRTKPARTALPHVYDEHSGVVWQPYHAGSDNAMIMLTGKLMQCLDTEQCPHARPMFSYALNRTVLVNQAPGVMNTALIMLNTYNQPIVKASAANVITVIAGEYGTHAVRTYVLMT